MEKNTEHEMESKIYIGDLQYFGDYSVRLRKWWSFFVASITSHSPTVRVPRKAFKVPKGRPQFRQPLSFCCPRPHSFSEGSRTSWPENLLS